MLISEIKFKKEWAVGFVLVIIVLLGIVLRTFPFNNGDFSKYTMPMVTSQDVFYHTEHSKLAYDLEHAKYYPPHRAQGVERVMVQYPPLFYVFVASFTKLAGLPVYQTSFFLISLLSVLIPLLSFVLVRKYFNEKAAWIVLLLGVFTNTTFLFQFIVGFWVDLFAFSFIPLTILLLKDFWDSKNYFVVVILMFLFTASAIGHMWEATYILFFFGITVLFVLLRKLKVRAIVRLVILFVGIFILIYPSLFHTVIFELWSEATYFVMGSVQEIQSYFPLVEIPWYIVFVGFFGLLGLHYLDSKKINLTNIGVMLGISALITGIIEWKKDSFGLIIFICYFIVIVSLSLIFLFSKSKKFPRDKLTILFFISAILFQGYARYLGFGSNQTYRQLYHGMSFLLIPFSIGVFYLLEILNGFVQTIFRGYLKKDTKWIPSVIVLIALVVVSIATFGNTYSELANIDRGSFSDDTEFEALVWLEQNTPIDSKVLTLYGFEHGYGRFSNREIYLGDLGQGYTIENIQKICQGIVPDTYRVGASYLGYIQGKGFKIYLENGSYEYKRNAFVDETYEKGTNMTYPTEFFDYIVFQTSPDPRYSPQSDPSQCMQFYLQEMSKENRLVWKNEKMAIIEVVKNESG